MTEKKKLNSPINMRTAIEGGHERDFFNVHVGENELMAVGVDDAGSIGAQKNVAFAM